MHALGQHLLVEMHACERAALDDLAGVERAMLEAARAAGATVLDHRFHRFAPQGVSGVVLIAESHLSIHTWPEHGYAAVDLFTCSPALAQDRAVDVLRARLGCARLTRQVIERGVGLGSPREV